MYRDDLEAAQARADALEREARDQTDRADAAEHEAEELRTKNTQLAWEAAAAQAKHEEREVTAVPAQRARPAPSAGVTPARMRQSIIGWSLMGAGGLTLFLSGRLELGGVAFGIGLVALMLGMILA